MAMLDSMAVVASGEKNIMSGAVIEVVILDYYDAL